MRIPRGLKVVSYGGGVNTIAVLVQLANLGVRPDAIVMADPGHEWPETYAYRDDVMGPWLAARGWPAIVVVTRKDELVHRKGGLNFETLGELSERTATLPSVAYGQKKCSFNYKAAPQRWWMERQEWAQAEWAAGRKIIKVIGYDADEDARVRPYFNDPVENSQYKPWYPLFDAEIDRAGCEALIRAAGLPVPRGSACTFCPNAHMDEWRELRDRHPALFAYAVEMSRRAEAGLTNPRECGLLRNAPKGRRQLHLWVDGAYGEGLPQDDPAAPAVQPCECAL